MRVLVEDVGGGLHPSETVVEVKTSDGGVERLVVSRRSIRDKSIAIGWPIGEKGDAFLIELPRETDTGAWRVWVKKEQLIDAEERLRA